MKVIKWAFAILVIAVFLVSHVQAQELIAYPATNIERHEVVDGKLILQGAEDGYENMRDGLGWTMAITEKTGQVVLTASGDQVAFVVFGAAVPL
jgi:hypothetical protein